ncbi:hypothetical protein WDU99_08310 [Microbacterium sp. Mu-80]|uniref:Uncharacterized protein n=1 Tax=Microbacterium bandirmense TaxID=3122050 RepID=A0ABU8LDA6_9MICO
MTLEYVDYNGGVWDALVRQMTDDLDLDFYPEGAVRAATEQFELDHDRPADPDNADDYAEVYEVALACGGYDF